MHLLAAFGRTLDEVNHHATTVRTVESTMGSDSTLARAKSIGIGIMGVAEVLGDLQPDMMFVLGDRGEVMGAALCAVEMNIPVVHLFGGDVCQGGVDEPMRHAITKLASVHLASNAQSADRIVAMGEEPWRVHTVGSPVLDLVRQKRYTAASEVLAKLQLDPSKPIIALLQHSVTWQIAEAEHQIRETMEAIDALGHHTVAVYPCSDPGYSDVIRVLEEYRGRPYFHLFKNLDHEDFLGLLAVATVFVGNSSAGLMETPSFKIPFVNIGIRQDGRLRAANVIDAAHDRNAIIDAINAGLRDRKLRQDIDRSASPYGDGHASEAIVELLCNIPLDKRLIQKRMTY
jgi:UDP-hydrolysing UDP-N-acetyl-D-glucosamine 2-epimerase